MSKTINDIQLTDQQAERLAEAQNDLERIRRDIAPFLKKRGFTLWRTAGRWEHAADLSYDGEEAEDRVS